MKATSSSFIVASALALIILSLPFEFNVSLRNALSQKLLVFSSFFHKSEPNVQDTQVESWLEQQKNKELKAKAFAASFNMSPQYLVGKVLFRAENSWNSCLWIDVGSEDNPKNGPKIVARNSPVLSGDSVVGIIDYVGKKESLVRLISDSGLTPSVRVARHFTDKALIYAIKTLEGNKELLQNEQEQKALSFLLSKLEQVADGSKEPLYLAKGILQGFGDPMWRSSGHLLKGIGFTYDFADDQGPARDLRTGEPIDPDQVYTPRSPVALVEVGDLLVTSGMDSLFPEGLKIARVESIIPLQEGAYAYELTASPTAFNLMELDYVTILPPQNFDAECIPDRAQRIVQQLDEN